MNLDTIYLGRISFPETLVVSGNDPADIRDLAIDKAN